MENNEKYLPIGSVVLLKGGTKKAMITGFCSVAEEDTKKMYDYTGCIYPEGFLDFDQICLFDHNQIEKVYHIGYIDEEEKNFKKELIEIANKFESGEESTTTFFNDYIKDEDEENNDESTEETEDNVVSDEQINDIELTDVNKDTIDNLEYL